VSEAIRTTRSLDWNPVRFQLTEETPDGPPAVGFLIALNEQVAGGGGVGIGQGAPQPTQRVTDGSGVADFGLVHPGDYSFQIGKDWADGSLATGQQLHIEPGSQISKRIVCPKTPPERVPVRIRWAWPADLKKENLVFHALFTLNPIQRDGLSWILSDERPSKSSTEPNRFRTAFMGMRWPATRSVLCGPGTSIARILPMKQPYIWKSPELPVRELWAELQTSDLCEIKEPAKTMAWERGTYWLSAVLVLRPIESTDSKAGKRRFDVIVASDPSLDRMVNGIYSVWDRPPTDAAADDPRTKGGPRTKGARRNTWTRGPSQLGQLGETDLVLPWESWSQTATSFEARPGQVNEWTIPLPDELIEAVREKLKDKK
jgi:hypothetical protein